MGSAPPRLVGAVCVMAGRLRQAKRPTAFRLRVIGGRVTGAVYGHAGSPQTKRPWPRRSDRGLSDTDIVRERARLALSTPLLPGRDLTSRPVAHDTDPPWDDSHDPRYPATIRSSRAPAR